MRKSEINLQVEHTLGSTTMYAYPARNRDLIVSFACAGHEIESAWGLPLIKNANVDMVGFVDNSKKYYPDNEIHQLLKKIDLSYYDRVFSYGYSKGGYAALRFSRALGAINTVALSPQTALDPKFIGSFDPRRVQIYFDPIYHSNIRIREEDLPEHCSIIVDPLNYIDNCHICHLRNSPKVSLIPAVGAGHDTIQYIVESGINISLLELILGNISPKEFRRRFREKRRWSRIYVETMAHYKKSVRFTKWNGNPPHGQGDA